MDSISAIPQQPQLGRLAQFLRYLETQNRPEFLPKQLDIMGLMAKLALPQASTVENLSYGNLPFTMPPQGTGAMIPQVKTGRKPEVADLIATFSGVPGMGAVADVGTKLSNTAADQLVRLITRNPTATAPGVLQETAMPFMNAVAPKVPSLLEAPVKSDLGFYSKLEEATIPLQNKGTGSQYLAQIENTAGVKPEEIQWTGLDEFLKSKPNVTKQEVQDYLAANRVDLQEVRLGDPSPEDVRLFMQDEAGRGYDYEDALDYLRSSEDSPKFSSYTLPGGENYREILLTLPSKNPEFDPADLSRLTELSNKTRTDAETAEYRALANRYDASLRGETTPEYRSSHFDQPNILAHMRVNDRVIDGKKTLFIEEIQSDWHQAGRKKGYANKENLEKWYNQNKLENDPPFAELNNEQLRVLETNRGAGMGGSNAVPDAPFKTTWHELSLKRAIQEASEKGYDRIAFTTGKTQAERYDLSKQVDRIAITKTGGVWSVNAWKDGAKAITKDASTDADLANLVGKELAEKAIKQGGGEYAGLDLQVGGEGMKGFYDNILPKSLDKLGKKFDAKVTKSKIQTEAKGRSFQEELQNSGFAGEWPAATPERRSEIIDAITAKQKQNEVEVWVMDITPKMRESVLTKGQPLFAATPAVPLGLLGGDEGE